MTRSTTEHLEDISVEDLQTALDDVSEKIAAQRLIAAIAYKHGISQSELSEWFAVERKTIYNWLTRLERADLRGSSRDHDRPGRPRKLDPEELEEFKATLRDPPTNLGYESPVWTTDLVRQALREIYRVTYSLASCRRIMREAGLRHCSRDEARNQLAGDTRDTFEEHLDQYERAWIPV